MVQRTDGVFDPVTTEILQLECRETLFKLWKRSVCSNKHLMEEGGSAKMACKFIVTPTLLP